MNDDLEQREKDIREQLERIKVLPKSEPERQTDWMTIGVVSLILIIVALATYLNLFF